VSDIKIMCDKSRQPIESKVDDEVMKKEYSWDESPTPSTSAVEWRPLPKEIDIRDIENTTSVSAPPKRPRGRPPKRDRDVSDGGAIKSARVPQFAGLMKELGLDPKLEAEVVLGACLSPSNEVMYLIRWKDTYGADLVPSRVARVVCPQVVIRYLERHVVFYE